MLIMQTSDIMIGFSPLTYAWHKHEVPRKLAQYVAMPTYIYVGIEYKSQSDKLSWVGLEIRERTQYKRSGDMRAVCHRWVIGRLWNAAEAT